MHGQIFERVGFPLLLLFSTFGIYEDCSEAGDDNDDDVNDDDDDDDDVDDDVLEVGGVHVKNVQSAWNRCPRCVLPWCLYQIKLIDCQLSSLHPSSRKLDPSMI